MTVERDRMIRNAALLAIQRVGLLLVGVVFAIIVPRTLGPDDYGRFGLLVSLMTWFYLLSDFGLHQVLSRHVPEALPLMNRSDRQRTLGSVVAFRGLVGVIASAGFVAASLTVLRDLPGGLLLPFALVIVLDAMAEPMFSWQLGQNHAHRWGSQFLIRRTLYLVQVPVGYVLAGLQGAAIAVLISEAIVLGVAIRWSGADFAPAGVRLDPTVLGPLLRFGFLFYIGNIVSSTFRYSGESLIRLATHDYAHVGYFGLCLSVYMAAEGGFLQLYAAMVPFMSRLVAEGRRDEVRIWFERVLVGATVAAGFATLATWHLMEDWTPRIFGEAYRPAIPGLRLVGATLLAGILCGATLTMSLILKRPRVFLAVALARLVVFAGGTWVLSGSHGYFGGCIALLIALAASGLAGLLVVGRAVRLSPRRWILALGPLAPLLALARWGTGYPLFFATSAGYLFYVWATRTITWSEIRAALRSAGRKTST